MTMCCLFELWDICVSLITQGQGHVYKPLPSIEPHDDESDTNSNGQHSWENISESDNDQNENIVYIPKS